MSEFLKPLPQSPTETKPISANVSVVIPTVGRAILESCLAWLVAGNVLPYSVIVVDQGNNPTAEKWVNQLENFSVRADYLPSKQRGRSAGLNRGLERVTTKFVAMTDDDCFVMPDWLEKMADRLEKAPLEIATGRVELAGDEKVAFSTVTDQTPKRFDKPQLKTHPFIGGNAGIAMHLVKQIGYFDESACLASAEDSDFGYRALRQGIPIVYDPEIALYHYHWRDESQRAQRYGDYARSQGGFYGKHLMNGDWLILKQAGRDLARAPVRWLRGWLKNDRDMIDRGKADTLNMLPGIWSGLQSRGNS